MTAQHRYPSTQDLLAIATRVGRGESQVRDLGLLGSAAARPQTTVFGDDAYPDLATKGAALLESLLRNHALVDGNKRLGWLSLVLFLALNGHRLDVPDDYAYDLVIGVAEGRRDVAQVAAQLQQRGVA